jgi:hypothetical protein
MTLTMEFDKEELRQTVLRIERSDTDRRAKARTTPDRRDHK